MARALVCLVVAGAACGNPAVPSPFQSDHDAGPGGAAGAAGSADESPQGGAAGVDTAGPPCDADEQCDDHVDCTFDHCDQTVGRCRFDPDHTRCADSEYCNGIELCDPQLGCVAGEPITCSDGLACTINRCVESERDCEEVPRDSDGDGDPDLACHEGGDCNDADPTVSSLAPEVCDNGRDDDCDGTADEEDCEVPEHDTCAVPLEIDGSGTFELRLGATRADYSASCAGGDAQWQDAVVAITVGTEAADVDVIADAGDGDLALATAEVCGDASSEIACAEGVEPPGGGVMARLRWRGLSEGSHPLYVFARSVQTVTLDVQFSEPVGPPDNETCATAESLVPDEPRVALLPGVARDVASACETSVGDLLYRFELDDIRDVRFFAVSLDGWGEPSLSLRRGACAEASDELTCRTADPVELFARALPAGQYTLAVSATGPTDVEVTLETSPPSTPPPDETCAGAPSLVPGGTVDVPLAEHADDVDVDCLVGAPDAAYALELEETSDVRLVQRISSGDRGGISLALPECTAADALACGTSTRSPVRVGLRGVDPGSYRVVSETVEGNPTQVTALTRPASPPTLVAFADDCDTALEIPPQGGFFQGNTVNASNDYEAGCDAGGLEEEGAAEQMLRLSLADTKRVILDMQGSGYRTLLDVRRGPGCPGTEVDAACSVGYHAERSYLDLILEPGEYFVQVDGYAGAVGVWFLDVFIVDP